MPVGSVSLVGILNITPDSFSDGGKFLSYEAALSHAHRLVDDGVDVIDIGGDSTRPGSICCGIEEEWERIGRLITPLSSLCRVSVDTHHAEVARRALDAGASVINDISGGSDPMMLEVVRNSGTHYVMMHSRCADPHHFGHDPEGDIVARVLDSFARMEKRACEAGIGRDKLLFDPGCGGFLSSKPEASWELLSSIGMLGVYSPLFLGISRKGFLRQEGEVSVEERDGLSSYLGALISSRLSGEVWLRVHNVAQQRIFLRIAEQFQQK